MEKAQSVTLKQLRIVEAIARLGKIVSAADALAVTPPAVTIQLKLLEETAGLPLFERSRNGLRLTDAGQLYLYAARRVQRTIEECTQAVSVMRGLGGGRVTVGLVSTAKYFVPFALAAFAKKYPGIELHLSTGNREQTLAALARLEVDIAITGYPPDSMEIQKHAIGDHPHVIIAPPDHRLAGRHRLKLADISDETFLLREPGSGTRKLMERLFAQEKVVPRVGMELESNETIKQSVMAGLGIAVISAHTIAAEVDSGRLVVLPVAGLPVMRKWYAIRATEKRVMPAAAAMWDFLVTEAAPFLQFSSQRPGSRRPRRKGARAP
jgi:DNA-binding transcriptional LysR family regulator